MIYHSDTKIPEESFEFEAGQTLLIDKPINWTSFDAVNKIRNTIRTKKVGHAGTLDPLASGLLIICTGKNTKLIEQFTGQNKTYIGTITLGFTTPSYDLETQPDAFFEYNHVSEAQIHQAAASFLGLQTQLPPIYSAIKINGQKLYVAARQNIAVEIRPREVTFYELEITNIELPKIDFKIVCSKGTYIRSFAYDFGQKLGSGACLSALCRTAIGEYKLENAWPLLEFCSHIKQVQNLKNY